MSGAAPPTRKRDVIRQWFRPSEDSRIQGAAQQAAPISQQPLQTIPLLDEVLRLLTQKERDIIRKYIVSGQGSLHAALGDVYTAAARKRDLCESKRWTWTIGGRIFKLHDEADKVVLWLDKFKSIGDIAANVDPLHAGLPWAGIRLILQATVSESRQMASLLSGLKVAFHMTHRLQVYWEYLATLPPTATTTTNLRRALIDFYLIILQFLSNAILNFEKSTFSRTLAAFWSVDVLDKFVVDCDRIGSSVDIEANNCDREFDKQDRAESIQLKKDLSQMPKILDEINVIRTFLDTSRRSIDLEKLPVAKGATYNSHNEEHLSCCLEGTRVSLLQQVNDWAADADAKRIFWLGGIAGSGKSTVARTIAQNFDQADLLGATFFFKRGEGDRGNASRFFPTLTMQIVEKIPGLDVHVAERIENDSFLYDKNLKHQFQHLLLDPLNNMASSLSPQTIVFVIDALDECDDELHIQTILDCLAELNDTTQLRIRIFVTSRPELPIRIGFGRMAREKHRDVQLEQLESTDHDISKFLQAEFEEIRSEFLVRRPRDPLPSDWPGDVNIRVLAELATPLFIFAATVCRFVRDRRGDPRQRLNEVLKQGNAIDPSKLDMTYGPILNQLIVGQSKNEQAKIATDFRYLIGTIVILAEPLSPRALSSLLGRPIGDIEAKLDWLHSVMSISADPEEPVRLLHLSFRDYLVDPQKSADNLFWVNEGATHAILAAQCLELLSSSQHLQRNICTVTDPATRRKAISAEEIRSRIPMDLDYACRFWLYHLAQSNEQLVDVVKIYTFLSEKFLYWIEALSWLERLGDVTSQLIDLQSIAKNGNHSQLLLFLNDALRFLGHARYVTGLAPIQLYASALAFAPTNSLTRQKFLFEIPAWLTELPEVPNDWSPELQTLEGHQSLVNCVAFSPGGRLLASGSHDRTIIVWEPVAGIKLHELKGHSDEVNCLAFAQDGSDLLASGSFDGTIGLWNSKQGERIGTLGKTANVGSLAFSSAEHGQLLASDHRDDKTKITIWDIKTREVFRIITGLTGGVNAIAFSPIEPKILMMSFSERQPQLWNVITGEEVHTDNECGLEGTDLVVFSTDGKLFACSKYGTIEIWNLVDGTTWTLQEDYEVGSLQFISLGDSRQLLATASDCHVHIWDFVTGRLVRNLYGHRAKVHSIAYTHYGQLLASGSWDTTVRLWDVAMSNEVQELKAQTGHKDRVMAVVFSTNGQILASASRDCTICVWALDSGKEMQKLQGHSDEVYALAFSSDGKQLASTSQDGTVRLWKTDTAEQVQCFQLDTVYTDAIAFSQEKQLLATTLYNIKIRIYDIASKGDVRLFGIHAYPNTGLAFSRNGEILASALMDGTIRLWNPLTGEVIQTFKHDYYITRKLWFSSDGEHLETEHDVYRVTGTVEEHHPSSSSSRNSSPSSIIPKTKPLGVRHQWVTYRGRDLLWLPFEYRMGTWDTYEDKLAIGLHSGRVICMSFGEPEF